MRWLDGPAWDVAAHGDGRLALAGLVLGSACLGWLWIRRRRRVRLLRIARDVTTRYARLLSVKQKQLVIHDGYGNYELRPWIDHVDYFIAHVILREARAQGLRVDHVRHGTVAWSRLTQTLLAIVNDREEGTTVEDGDIISGEHYETLCRNLLQDQGWRVDTTPVTGDQGADLIAEAGGCRVIIQCKFYTRPVGNKAVQEAYAAMTFHAGDRAAVVSNASFTRSARDLAQASRVLLLHHNQLAELDRIIRHDGLDRSSS